MKQLLSVLLVFVIAVGPIDAHAKKSSAKSYFEVVVYHYSSETQQGLIEKYLESSLVPALHSLQLRAGVFRPIANDTAKDKTIYVITDYKSWQQLNDMRAKLASAIAGFGSAAEFTGTPHTAPAFSRKETMIMEAFPMMTSLEVPALKSAKAEHVYEWRSYESATEDLFINKVKMFNEGGEVTLFKRLNFNAVFYSSVIAGARMPNLIYMTSFENLDDRNEHWKTFGSDPEWKKLSSLPKYQNNVSKADIILMKALPFSDY